MYDLSGLPIDALNPERIAPCDRMNTATRGRVHQGELVGPIVGHRFGDNGRQQGAVGAGLPRHRSVQGKTKRSTGSGLGDDLIGKRMHPGAEAGVRLGDEHAPRAVSQIDDLDLEAALLGEGLLHRGGVSAIGTHADVVAVGALVDREGLRFSHQGQRVVGDLQPLHANRCELDHRGMGLSLRVLSNAKLPRDDPVLVELGQHLSVCVPQPHPVVDPEREDPCSPAQDVDLEHRIDRGKVERRHPAGTILGHLDARHVGPAGGVDERGEEA